MKPKAKPKALRSKKVKHPRFLRPNVGRSDRRRLEDKWRRPRGVDNKQREKLARMGAHPVIGYRNPREVRGLHPSGYREVLARCLNDIDSIPEGVRGEVAVRLASTIGARKRASMVKRAEELGLKLLN